MQIAPPIRDLPPSGLALELTSVSGNSTPPVQVPRADTITEYIFLDLPEHLYQPM
jgi:hypothetical protein